MSDVVAMLLAGREGKRLGAITRKLSKPAVHFGGSYRLTDFPLSNCTNSSITSAGVLLRYRSLREAEAVFLLYRSGPLENTAVRRMRFIKGSIL